jgi:hypothetical protein
MTTVDIAKMEALVREHAAAKAVEAAEAFVAVVRSLAPRRSGDLAASVEADRIYDTPSGTTAVIVVSSPYARFQNEGTGIYGPEGTPIVPKNGQFLVFPKKIGGGLVFTREVRGTEPTHFWERSIERWPDILRSLA